MVDDSGRHQRRPRQRIGLRAQGARLSDQRASPIGQGSGDRSRLWRGRFGWM